MSFSVLPHPSPWCSVALLAEEVAAAGQTTTCWRGWQMGGRGAYPATPRAAMLGLFLLLGPWVKGMLLTRASGGGAGRPQCQTLMMTTEWRRRGRR